MNFLQNVEHVANKTVLRDTSTKKLPNVELLIKLATFGPGTNREPLEGLFSDMGPCEQKASQYLHKCINAYVSLRQLDTFSKLCFSESEAFETKQLANE